LRLRHAEAFGASTNASASNRVLYDPSLTSVTFVYTTSKPIRS